MKSSFALLLPIFTYFWKYFWKYFQHIDEILTIVFVFKTQSVDKWIKTIFVFLLVWMCICVVDSLKYFYSWHTLPFSFYFFSQPLSMAWLAQNLSTLCSKNGSYNCFLHIFHLPLLVCRTSILIFFLNTPTWIFWQVSSYSFSTLAFLLMWSILVTCKTIIEQ